MQLNDAEEAEQPQPPQQPPQPPRSPPRTQHHSRAFLWGLMPLFVLLVASLVLLHRRQHARSSRNEANLRISRDRANLDLHLQVHANEVMRKELSERSSSREGREAQGKEDDPAKQQEPGR